MQGGTGVVLPMPKPKLVLSKDTPLNSARKLVQRCYTNGMSRIIRHSNDTFYVWNGTHYIDMRDENIRPAIWQFLDSAYCSAGGKFNPNPSKVAEVRAALAGLVQLPSTIQAPAWLDGAEHPPANEMLVCQNGVLHLPTLVLHPHSPALFTLNALDYAHDATAPHPPEWSRFLHSLWGDDHESIATLQEMFGLLLTGETRHQKIFMLVGPKRSGKGTIARVLTALLGQANVASPTLNALTQTFGLQPLIGKRLAITALTASSFAWFSCCARRAAPRRCDARLRGSWLARRMVRAFLLTSMRTDAAFSRCAT